VRFPARVLCLVFERLRDEVAVNRNIAEYELASHINRICHQVEQVDENASALYAQAMAIRSRAIAELQIQAALALLEGEKG
jgi:hypothetical protein